MEPSLRVKLLCVVPQTLVAIAFTANVFDLPYAIVYHTVQTISGLLWLYSMVLNRQYAMGYRCVLVLHVFAMQHVWLWRAWPAAAAWWTAFILGLLLLALVSPQRLRTLLSRML